MNCIVAVDKNWGIGKNNGLLFSLKKDMAFFRSMTIGKVVVVGANTFNSFPSGPLKDRLNVVLDGSGTKREGTVSVASLDELLQTLKEYNSDDVFVIGGASVYKLLLPYCSVAYVTKVQATADADTFFPNLDADPDWQLAQVGEDVQDNGYTINFCEYRKV